MPRISRSSTPLATALLCGVLAVALAGCGEKRETGEIVTQRDAVTVELDALPSVNHAAIYAAQQTGAFERAGLTVTIKTPTDPSEALPALDEKAADFVVTSAPELLLARGEGAKVQGVAALIQRPLSAIISLPSDPVRKPADLEGKTIATGGLAYQGALLQTILRTSGVKQSRVSRRDLGLNVMGPLAAGRVDAAFALRNTATDQLTGKAKQPIVLPVESLGVPTYNELVLATTETTARSRGPVVRRFVQAIGLGASALRRDPAVGLNPLIAANPALDRTKQAAALEATLPLMVPTRENRPYGWMDPTDWPQLGAWMQNNGLLEDERVASRATTNEYLAGEGVGDRTDS